MNMNEKTAIKLLTRLQEAYFDLVFALRGEDAEGEEIAHTEIPQRAARLADLAATVRHTYLDGVRTGKGAPANRNPVAYQADYIHEALSSDNSADGCV